MRLFLLLIPTDPDYATTSSQVGRCYMEDVATDACGDLGFQDDINYDFYKLEEGDTDVCNIAPRDDLVGATVEVAVPKVGNGTDPAIVECWQHAHPEEMNVYDFSRWVGLHPGNLDELNLFRRNPIMQPAGDGLFELWYPNHHPMSRWKLRHHPNYVQSNIIYVGLFEGPVDVATLPSSLQTATLMEEVGATYTYDSSSNSPGFESCGSRGEVANDPEVGNRFYSLNYEYDVYASTGVDQLQESDEAGKSMTWTTVVFNAPDQLRQRAAWSLAQIFTAGAPNFGYDDETELWVAFYDIFVANAFGNFRDIIREVSYSPVMGEYLTYRGNSAFASNGGKFPDENFARELMQLFTIGLWELNVDGTYKTNDDTGGLIPTYSSANVRDFAKVWTGFEHQSPRSNVERHGQDRLGYSKNLIDPMLLIPTRRDRFPKTLLRGTEHTEGYLGDTYPLCSDLPRGHFLLKGAKYKYHGPTSMFGREMDQAVKEGNEPTRAHFEPQQQSQLHAALCSKRGDRCTFPPVVVLPVDLDCHGASECNAEMVHAVKIVDIENSVSGFYTYVAPPCVRLQFFEGQVAAYKDANACTDPQVASTVGTQCCHTSDLSGVISPLQEGICLHLADTMKYATAQKRCAALYEDGIVCPREVVESETNDRSIWQASCSKFQYAWLVNEPCKLQVQVYPSGLVGLVDTKASYHIDYMRVDSGNTFQVHWEDDLAMNAEHDQQSADGDGPYLFPVYSSDGCGAGCVAIHARSGSCLCEAVVVDEEVVVLGSTGSDEGLPSEAVLRAKLQIGAFPPEQYNGTYTRCTNAFCTTRQGISVYVRGTTSNPATLGSDAIFEFAETSFEGQQTPSPQKPTKYLMNKRSVVHIGNPTHEFVLLDPTPIGIGACSASSQFGTGEQYACNQAFKGGGEYYSNGTKMVGTWLYADFERGAQLLESIDVKLVGNVDERPSQILLEFSDGTSHSVALQNTAGFTKVILPNVVETSYVNITIESANEAPCIFPFIYQDVAYAACTAFEHDRYWCATHVDQNGVETDWRNCVQGFGETRFLPPDAASRLSSTPCKDAGMLPVTKDECEKSARYVVPDGYEMTVDNWYGRLDIGDNSDVPGCAVWAGHRTAEVDRYDGPWTPYWNTRAEVLDWGSAMWPVCKRPTPLSSSGGSGGGYTFRNPPHFMANTAEASWMPGIYGDLDKTFMPFGDGDHLLAFAEHETNALIDHVVEHANTAPFIAKRLIQRLVTSNPSPRYVKSVATAFTEGAYGSRTYTGRYGDMAATFSAILLDPEARSSVLDLDPTHGQLREPLLKVMHLLRAMEFRSEHERDIELSALEDKIGQMAFASPSVFSYFLPEFAPDGPVQRRGLVAPEAQIATAPYLIGYLNGVYGIIERGLSGCSSVDHAGAFGAHRSWSDCRDDESIAEASEGRLHFKPQQPSNPGKVVEELAVLLTGGRMSEHTHNILLRTYSQYFSETPFNMSAALSRTMAATFAEEECLAAIQDYVHAPTPLPVEACSASSAASTNTTCAVAHDGTYAEAWRYWGAAKVGGAVPWIAFTLADTSVVGRIALTGCNSNAHAQPKTILVQFGNGEGGVRVEVTKDSLCENDRAFIKLEPPVATAFVNLTFETNHEPPACIFPFTYPDKEGNAIVYTSCTDFNHHQHWCATKVDPDTFAEVEWGDCEFENSTSITVAMALNEVQFYNPGTVPIDIISDEKLHTGSWTSMPPGCSKRMHPYNDAYFNHDPTGCSFASCNGYDLIIRNKDEHLWVTAEAGVSIPWAAVDGKAAVHTKDCIASPSSGAESPWLEIYLGNVELNITSISLHQQSNWGAERNDGLSVYVGDTQCASNAGPFKKLGEASRIPCIGKGNKVRIVNPGAGKTIRFCEVQINVALQSDEAGTFPANEAAEKVALQHSLKVLALSAPEYHSTNVNAGSPNPKRRAPPGSASHASLNREFKAVVVVFLSGGADSYNMVVPLAGCKRKANASDLATDSTGPTRVPFDYYAEYAETRGNDPEKYMALRREELLPIETDNQPCKTFGLHPELKHLKKLYDEGDLSVLANVGPLVEPATRQDWDNRNKRGGKRFPVGIGGHNTMQKDAFSVHSGERNVKGVLGRIANVLTAEGMPEKPPLKSQLYSMDGYAQMLDGSVPPTIVGNGGIIRFHEYATIATEMADVAEFEESSMFSETLAQSLQTAIHSTETLGQHLENTSLASGRTFPPTSLGSQLAEAAKVIQIDTENFNMERSMYFTRVGGYDTHDTVDIGDLMRDLDTSLEAFADEMKGQNRWEGVTVVVASEFGRTLASNALGADHGWGGNYVRIKLRTNVRKASGYLHSLQQPLPIGSLSLPAQEAALVVASIINPPPLSALSPSPCSFSNMHRF